MNEFEQLCQEVEDSINALPKWKRVRIKFLLWYDRTVFYWWACLLWDWFHCQYCGATATDQKHWETRPIEDELNATITQLTAEIERLKQEVVKEAAWNEALSDNNKLQFQHGEKLTAERDECKSEIIRLELEIATLKWKGTQEQEVKND